MLERGDLFVYVVIVLLLVFWGLRVRKKQRRSTSPVPKSGKMVALLEAEGYEIVSGKVKIPLHLFVGEREIDSAMTADGLVKLSGRTYVVVKEREEERLTAKFIREHYLANCLAFRADGVVLINLDKPQIKQIDISVKSSAAYSRLKLGLISFLLGVTVTFFWIY